MRVVKGESFIETSKLPISCSLKTLCHRYINTVYMACYGRYGIELTKENVIVCDSDL